MRSQQIDPSSVSEATNIPESRLKRIIGSEPEVADVGDCVGGFELADPSGKPVVDLFY